MSVKNTWIDCSNSDELKDTGKEFIVDTVCALFGDPIAAIMAVKSIFHSPMLIQNFIFWGKYRMFMDGILTDDGAIRKLSEIFADNEEKIEFAERVISTIDKIETKQKALYISNLTRALCSCFICKEDYYRLLWCIVNVPFEDLLYLSGKIDNTLIYDNIHLRFLEKSNLVTKDNTPIFTKPQIEQGKNCHKYTFTDFARILDQYALSYESKKYNYTINESPLGSKQLEIPDGTQFIIRGSGG